MIGRVILKLTTPQNSYHCYNQYKSFTLSLLLYVKEHLLNIKLEVTT